MCKQCNQRKTESGEPKPGYITAEELDAVLEQCPEYREQRARFFAAPEPTAGRVTMARLTELEPRLAGLLAEAATYDPGEDPHFCANNLWIDDFRPRLERLVGWYAESREPLLHTQAAYRVAHSTVYHALPDCRECHCL